MTFLRYFLVQIFAYFIDFFFYYIFLVIIGSPPLISNAASKIFAGSVAFILHRKFTFRTHLGDGFYSEGIGYIFALCVNLPLSSGVLYLCLGFFQEPFSAKIASDILVLGFTYVFLNKLVFKMSNRKRL